MTIEFAWIGIYEELARKLLDYERRQPELVAMLGRVAGRGLKVGTLADKDANRAVVPMSEIDPFTFFGTFNRGTRFEERRAILEALRTEVGLSSQPPVPSEFPGIPVVNNQQSWFIPYKEDRRPDDVAKLWELFRGAVLRGRDGIDPAVFERCLKIKTVQRAKLTMGLYWIRPREFVPLDSRSREFLQAKGVDVPADATWASYLTVLHSTIRKLGADFPTLSLRAWESTTADTAGDTASAKAPAPVAVPGVNASRRYWAGGFGEDARAQMFIEENFWEIRWPKDSTHRAARATWGRYANVRVGDWLAIKGLGGRYQLRVRYVGEVIAVDAAGRVRLKRLEKPLFQGRPPAPPGDGNWFDTLSEVTNPDARAFVFGDGKAPEPVKFERPNLPLNLILYGPPGTGKTYRLANTIRDQFRQPDVATTPLPPNVSGLTWFEVVAIAVYERGPCEVPVLLDHPLIRAKHAERGVATRLGPIVWGQLQGHTVHESTTVNYERRYGLLVFDRLEDGRWHLPNGLPEELRDLVEADNAAAPEEVLLNELLVTFHPSFSYEEFVEGMRPRVADGDSSVVEYPILPGVFKEACERAVAVAGFSEGIDAFCRLSKAERADILAEAPAVVLLIDEINRGNVARIFGELITLIEANKRLGSPEELIVTLPGSRQRFGVPANLWIIGTMNTADRSVVALDIALRRRFEFLECAPEYDALDEVEIEGVNLGRMLRAINARLVRLCDPDHQIGHAYLWGLEGQPIGALKHAFDRAIIPLLREYFHDDLGRIGLVLGERFVQPSDGPGIFAKFAHEHAEDLAERRVWVLTNVSTLDAVAFRAIYA